MSHLFVEIFLFLCYNLNQERSLREKNKSFYRFNEKKVATNKEESKKYVDVLCIYEYVYEIVKEDYLTKHYKDIKYLTNGYLILQNNKVYFYG